MVTPKATTRGQTVTTISASGDAGWNRGREDQNRMTPLSVRISRLPNHAWASKGEQRSDPKPANLAR
jgi:hypothetical protein